MTDRQFDTHLRSLVRALEDIREEIREKGPIESKKLERLLNDIEEQLRRP